MGIINVDLNPIEHVWDIIDRRVQAVDSPVQNLRRLEAAYIALGMAAATTAAHLTTDWRDETGG